VRRDELSWLIGALEVVVDVETTEIFWDQARAGFPRLITQKCSNRHGRFLTIEECEGRKRSGTVLVSEGRHHQGWVTLIAELRVASSSLRVSRERREIMISKVVTAGKSFAEVAGLSKKKDEEVSGLREASASLEVPASASNGCEEVLGKVQSSLGLTHAQVEKRGCLQKAQIIPGTSRGAVEAKAAHRCSGSPSAKQNNEVVQKCQVVQVSKICAEGVACPGVQGNLKGREEAALNAIQELGCLREWLKRVRGEVDEGLGRIEAVFKRLEHDGPGQEKKNSAWNSKPKRENKFKGKKAVNFKVGSDSGSAVVKSILKPKSLLHDGAGTSAGLGSVDGPVLSQGESGGPTMEMDAGLDSADGSGSSPGVNGGPFVEMGLMMSQPANPGSAVGRGLVEGSVHSPALSGSHGACLGSSGAGETSV
jgi:hypothetical protein